MLTKSALSIADAKDVATAALAEAARNGWTVVAAIVDDGGHLMYLEKMDGTQLGSITVAQEKARTALLFKRPTKAIEDVIQGGRNVMLNLPGATPIEGGLPLYHDGQLVGAIGISGVQSSQDGICAAAGAAVLAGR